MQSKEKYWQLLFAYEWARFKMIYFKIIVDKEEKHILNIHWCTYIQQNN